MTADHHRQGAGLRHRLENEGRQHPPSGTPVYVLRSRGVWPFERVFLECAGCGAEQGSKPFFLRPAIDPVELGQVRVRANAKDKSADDGGDAEDDHDLARSADLPAYPLP